MDWTMSVGYIKYEDDNHTNGEPLYREFEKQVVGNCTYIDVVYEALEQRMFKEKDWWFKRNAEGLEHWAEVFKRFVKPNVDNMWTGKQLEDLLVTVYAANSQHIDKLFGKQIFREKSFVVFLRKASEKIWLQKYFQNELFTIQNNKRMWYASQSSNIIMLAQEWMHVTMGHEVFQDFE